MTEVLRKVDLTAGRGDLDQEVVRSGDSRGVGGVSLSAGSAPSSGAIKVRVFFFLGLSSSPVVLLRPGEDPRLSEHFIAPIRPPIKPPINSFRNSTRRLVRPRRRRRQLWMWMRHPEEPQKCLGVYDVLFREDNKTFRLRRYRRSSNGGVKRCRHSILYRSCGRAERKRKTPH